MALALNNSGRLICHLKERKKEKIIRVCGGWNNNNKMTSKNENEGVTLHSTNSQLNAVECHIQDTHFFAVE